MPIEIKELVIKAVVAADQDDRGGAASSEEANAELIESCVREVLRVLKRSKGR